MKDFINIIDKCWSKETCSPKFRDKWNEKNPTLGHCTITSILVFDYFGGDIYKVKVGDIFHCFNIIDNELIDLTASQFKGAISYDNIIKASKEELLENVECEERYLSLKQRYEQECAENK